MKTLHTLLARQLRQHFGPAFEIPPEWNAFISCVNGAYGDFDADRALLEHSLELSSQELLDANSQMRAVFDALPDPVFRLNHGGTILDAKAGINGELNFDRQEWISRRIEDTPLRHVAPKFAEAIQNVAATNEPVCIEYSAVAKGHESHYEARLVPLLEKQILVLIRNITERKQSLRLLGAAVEQASEAIVITDSELHPHGPRVLFANQAFLRMSGYDASEVLGKTPHILEGPKSDPVTLQRIKDTLARGVSFHGELTNYRKDGTEFVAEWQIVPLRDSTGMVTHFLGMHRDITARKQAEANLEILNKELLSSSRQAGMAEVATSVLHNVGNVLNSVNIASACLAESLGKSKSVDLAKVADLLSHHEADLPAFFATDRKARLIPGYLAQLAKHLAGEQASAMKELALLQKNIEHIKEIVRMQQDLARTSCVTEVLSPIELVEDALRMNWSGLAGQHIEVVREFQEAPAVTTQKHQVLQILVNLIRNAKHACEATMRGDRRVIIRTTVAGSRVRISVIDNGVGIPPEHMDRIFSRGFTTKKNGHGFGLHSAVHAAKEMGGELRVVSDGPGKGATFTLELPVAQAHPVASAEAA
ncbi:MAG TPA: PAS domain S-box protein [Verrucomicrobiae bacterium]|nr:PAS domain S-box protein [Verrucomicrobiae bacterium]